MGIDIGASAVKIVELEREESRYKLKNYAVFSLKDCLKENWHRVASGISGLSNQDRAEVIKEAIKEAKIKSVNAYLSLPVYSSFSTLIDFPSMSEKEIGTAIPYEAKKYVPVPLTEVILDWSIVNPLDQQKGFQVLLMAVPKKIVNDYKKMLQLTNLSLSAFESEVFSLSRALVGNDKSTLILVDIGARSVSLSIVDNGFIRMVGNLEMGGLKLTKTIAEKMKVSLEEAEGLKKDLTGQRVSPERSVQLKEIVHLLLGAVTFEIKKVIDSYQNRYKRRVERCILVGGGLRVAGLTDYFVDKLGVEVSLGKPFARVAYPASLESAIGELSPSLAVAVGLAMRGK